MSNTDNNNNFAYEGGEGEYEETQAMADAFAAEVRAEDNKDQDGVEMPYSYEVEDQQEAQG